MWLRPIKNEAGWSGFLPDQALNISGAALDEGSSVRGSLAVFCFVSLFLFVVLASGFILPQAQAQAQAQAAQLPYLFDGSQIADIRVAGNRRVETSSILVLAGLKSGDSFTAGNLNKATKGLYGSGFFSDVSLERSGSTLIIRVFENAIINQIAFEGNFSATDEILRQELQLKPRSVVTTAKIKNDIQRMLSVYRASGRYDVQIEPKLIKLEQNRVNLVFEVNEGPKSKIRSINFVGNRAFTDSKLSREILSRRAAWWRILTAVDSYDPDRISADKELLRRFYFEEGYPDFEIKTTLGELRETDRTFVVTFFIKEGPRYQVGRQDIDSKLPGVSIEDLRQELKLKNGEYYDGEKIEETVGALRDAVGDQGFAFVEVTPDLDKKPKEKLVNITFKIGEGPKVIIEKINVIGNTRTRENVIRREFRVVEGDAFSIAKVRRSRERLQGLGFFSRIDVKDRRGSAADRVVLDVNLEERNTGSLEFGAAYSTSGGISGLVGYSERNFLGRGTRLNATLNLSADDRDVSLNISEPYLFGRNMTGGIDLSYVKDKDTTDKYEETSIGGGLSVGYAINENVRQNWGLLIKNSEIVPDDENTTSKFLLDEKGDTLRVILSHGIRWAKLDNPSKPRSGVRISMRNEYAGLGGDVDYLKGIVSGSAYYPLGDSFTLAWNGEAGVLHTLKGDARISDRFFLGQSKIRGYDIKGIGPRTVDNEESLGGTKYYASTLELRVAIPNPLELDVEARVFGDIGSLWDPDNPYGNVAIDDTNEWRASYGVGFSWTSPIGPLQLDWGWPINEQSFDKLNRFRFSIGTRF